MAAGSVFTARGLPRLDALQSAHKHTKKRSHYRSRPDLEPPVLEVTGGADAGTGEADTSYVFLSAGGPLIADIHGEPVWYRPAPHYSTNLKIQQFQGQSVLTWWQGKSAPYGVGASGEYVLLDARYQEVARVKAANGLAADLHEFTIGPDGTGYFTSYQPITADLSPVGGPTSGKMLEAWIQGVDVATGKLVFEWRSSDHIALTESYRAYKSTAKWPYTPVHLNSIAVLPDGNLLVSARHTWTIYKIDRATGDILWRLGGKKSDFTLGPGVRFAWQHDAQWHNGEVLTIFDNESPPAEASQSRGLVLQVTEPKKLVTLRHAYYYPGEELLVGAQGSVQILPNGDVFMGWGLQPYFTQYRHDGRAVLKGHFKDSSSYRALRLPWTGTPAERPAVAVERHGGSGLRVYASWNGATEVAHWSVAGGHSRDSLSPLGKAARSGFETAIDVDAPTHVRYVAARAHDAAGRILATSPARRV